MVFIFYDTFILHNYLNSSNVCFYGWRFGSRYCGLSIFLSNSEILADRVQKDIVSLLIEFLIEQVIREIPVIAINYLSSDRKG